MKCPQCGEELVLREVVLDNVKNYKQPYKLPQVAATVCCSKPVKVKAVITMEVCKTETEAEYDDFGIAFKQT